MPPLNQEKVKEIVKVALDAGEIAKEFFFKRDFQIQIKKDNSKVSTADLKISEFIRSKLSNLLPGFEIICEENHPKTPAGQNFLLIDPIDGTNSFINQNDQFAINIALINNQKSIFGLIYAPLFENGKIAFNDHNNKVYFIDNIVEGIKPINNLQRHLISSTSNTKSNQLQIVTSKRTNNDQLKSYLSKHHGAPDYVLEKISSSVKFFRLIEGCCDIFINLKNTMEWDIAAGQAIVESLGGSLKKLEMIDENFILKENMNYNKKGYLNGPFIAFA